MIDNFIIEKYFILLPKYKRLGENLKHALETIFSEKSVDVLTIKQRTKKLDNFLEKIQRKNYKDPFEEMEDICGIRLISYFPSEVEEIKEIIETEFDVLEIINKDNRNAPTQFGYRSQHYILKIKKEWAKTPHFKGLEDLKFEMQIRTVLMHAWAEIEHKLAYKKFQHIPPQFRRKFSLLSAKLEEADEQFEELMRNIKDYKVSFNVKKNKQDVNLDNLMKIWNSKFPRTKKKIKEMRDILDRLQEANIPMHKLKQIVEREKISEKQTIQEALGDLPQKSSKKFERH
jgi:ppGpp synthetase/RelA/SpoT-type nucleotidyltranferase